MSAEQNQPGPNTQPGAFAPPPGVQYAYPPMPYPYAQAYPYLQPPFARPDPHWGWVIGAFFCFWPVAIAACVNAAHVDSAWMAGDWQGALNASSEAEKFGKIGVFIGIGLTALSIVIGIIFAVTMFAALG